MTELNEEMTAPKEGGLHKLLVEDPDEVYLVMREPIGTKSMGNIICFLSITARGTIRDVRRLVM